RVSVIAGGVAGIQKSSRLQTGDERHNDRGQHVAAKSEKEQVALDFFCSIGESSGDRRLAQVPEVVFAGVAANFGGEEGGSVDSVWSIFPLSERSSRGRLCKHVAWVSAPMIAQWKIWELEAISEVFPVHKRDGALKVAGVG
ncbi:hypothetical protein U1Q18_027807, partial [Sarracenia purpurea var. burkii]